MRQEAERRIERIIAEMWGEEDIKQMLTQSEADVLFAMPKSSKSSVIVHFFPYIGNKFVIEFISSKWV